MTLFFLLLATFYFIIILYFFTGIFRIPAERPASTSSSLTVTVLVPARNEEKNIIRCLESLWQQSYPRNRYNVIVIDDHSTDKTAELVETCIRNKANFELLRHKKDPVRSTFKKEALNFALEKVDSDIVMTIDADSVALPNWIEKMVAYYDSNTGMVAGLVTFLHEGEWGAFQKLQTLEFAGIVFCGVGAAGHNNPLICNGSNLSYRLQTFKEAGGYRGNEFLPSGDDDLLLQNIHNKTAWKIKYSLDPDTINYTLPLAGFSDFINQRARWASKSIHYPKWWLFLVLLAIYLYYASLILLLPAAVFGLFSWTVYISGLLLKMIPEALIISRALSVLQRSQLGKYFVVAQPLQIIYVLIVGFLGFFKKFNWKDIDRHAL